MPPGGILKRSSYYDADYRQSPALIRARRPYLFKNMVTGAALTAFVIGIYAFTFRAVGQDDFEDVKAPDVPAESRKPQPIGLRNKT